MIRTALSTLAGAALLASAAMPAMSQQPVAGQGEWNGSASFDQQVLAYIGSQNLPGVTIAGTKGGRLVLTKGYGYADLESHTQMQPWHKTYIGSVSKMLTAMAAMKLVEDGKLSLTGRVYGTAS